LKNGASIVSDRFNDTARCNKSNLAKDDEITKRRYRFNVPLSYGAFPIKKEKKERKADSDITLFLFTTLQLIF